MRGGASMDDVERIPIDLGHEVAAEAGVAQSAHRTTVKEDGTMVIDILVEQPCTPSSEGEIVVCAAAEDGARFRPPPPPPVEPTLAEKIGEALSAEIGPVEVGSIAKSDGTRVFGARVRF
jgi:hypothetical protein